MIPPSSTGQNRSFSHDVIVIGAGPGGSTTAFYLAQAGLNTLLLDKADFPRDKTCGDGLTPRALHVLAEIGVLDSLAAQGCVMEQATVYAPSGRPISTTMPDRGDFPPYMLAVPRLLLDETIRQQALKAGTQFCGGVHVADIEPIDGGVRVRGRRGGKAYEVTGRMAVIAIGASTKLLLQLGLLKEIPPLILAARTYYEEIPQLSGQFEFHFDGVPLPGYGWIFPLSAHSANIGAGLIPSRRQKSTINAKTILEQFVAAPFMRQMLAGARQSGPIKGFPLRTDFATAPVTGPRLLLVGEAAGLVNPVTGEGVDYALESGKLAAAQLSDCFTAGDFSAAALAGYETALRERFQELFVFSSRIRDWYINGPVLNRLVYVANQRDNIRELFTDIVLGNADASRATSLKTLSQIAFTL